ncbi:unnamed protein product [Malus baccata var. baccata]
MAPTTLLGPPEIRLPTSPPHPQQPTSCDRFTDLMVANFNRTTIQPTRRRPPNRLDIEQLSTFLSSGNPCLDFFFYVVPDTPASYVNQQLSLAWSHNVVTALKLICNLRGVRGTGESDNEGFYKATFWLHQNHPKTLAWNATSVAQISFFKDFPEILYRLVEGQEVRENQKVECDPNYRFLQERVSDVFAKCLKHDIENLKFSKKNPHFTLAAKWCPSLNSHYDCTTLLCESIAMKVFPKELYAEYQTIDDEHYAYRVRDRLRNEVLAPLRKALKLPEVYMSSNQWSSLPYNRVASVAMTLYKEIFLWHDKIYLEDVEAGKTKITAGALLPHQIISSLEEGDIDGKYGKMRNCLAACDVSGSMCRITMDVSVALGLLVSELSEEPWKGKVITFSQSPQLHLIQGDDLQSKCEFVRSMNWGMNTDFQKVFDLLLEVAVNGNMRPEHMIKRIFVFSDMEFDEASENNWETDYEAIRRKFKEKGNLRHSSSTPVFETQPRMALVCGFFKNMLKLFMNNDGEVRPNHVMEAAISGKEYRSLVVVD